MKEQELSVATHGRESSNFLLPISPQLQLQLPRRDTIPTHLLQENTELRLLR